MFQEKRVCFCANVILLFLPLDVLVKHTDKGASALAILAGLQFCGCAENWSQFQLEACCDPTYLYFSPHGNWTHGVHIYEHLLW